MNIGLWHLRKKKEIIRRKEITLCVWLGCMCILKRSWKRKFYRHCHKLSAFLIILLVGLSYDWRPLMNDAFQEVSFFFPAQCTFSNLIHTFHSHTFNFVSQQRIMWLMVFNLCSLCGLLTSIARKFNGL